MKALRVPAAAWNALFLASLVGIGILTAVRVSLARSPNLPPFHREQLQASWSDRRSAEQAAEEALSRVRPRVWKTDVNGVASEALETLAAAAQRHHLQLADFRSDKAVEISLLEGVPIVAQFQGSFLDFANLLHDVEGPTSRLAPTSLQITPSDVGAGQVTATLGLMGFRIREEGA